MFARLVAKLLLKRQLRTEVNDPSVVGPYLLGQAEMMYTRTRNLGNAIVVPVLRLSLHLLCFIVTDDPVVHLLSSLVVCMYNLVRNLCK